LVGLVRARFMMPGLLLDDLDTLIRGQNISVDGGTTLE
jgi:hypothetical protein